RKDQAPRLPAQRKLRVLPAILFLQGRDVEDVVHLRPAQLLDAEKILHIRVARASRPLASASRRRGLSFGAKSDVGLNSLNPVLGSSLRRDAATNTRDACATPGNRVPAFMLVRRRQFQSLAILPLLRAASG